MTLMAQPKGEAMPDYVAKAKRVMAGIESGKREAVPGLPPTPSGAQTEEQLRRETALTFVNRAGARLVCPNCHVVPKGARFAILVPEVNDTPEFQAALGVLRLDHIPVVHRDVPLGFRPEVEHRKRTK